MNRFSSSSYILNHLLQGKILLYANVSTALLGFSLALAYEEHTASSQIPIKNLQANRLFQTSIDTASTELKDVLFSLCSI